MTTRDELHRLVDAFPEEEAAKLLAFLRELPADPIERALVLAPIDDESLTQEDEVALAAGQQAIERGETLSMEDLRRQLGL
ncbi:MAG: hypothetical protein ACLGIN_00660 [Candidatus Sericytochromatia bacterium]